MINIFKKKPKECKHKYKDFPWFITYERDERSILQYYRVKIVEPYVCLICKKRVDMVLSCISNVDIDDVEDKIKDLKKRYKDKLEERAVVEDMVNDCQLVDKSFLESYEYSQKVTEDIMKSMHEQTPGSPCSVSEAITILSKSCPENQVKENKSGSNNNDLKVQVEKAKEQAKALQMKGN